MQVIPNFSFDRRGSRDPLPGSLDVGENGKRLAPNRIAVSQKGPKWLRCIAISQLARFNGCAMAFGQAGVRRFGPTGDSSRTGNHPGRWLCIGEKMAEPTLWDLLLDFLGISLAVGDSAQDEAGTVWWPGG
jgi:hypothetical protein